MLMLVGASTLSVLAPLWVMFRFLKRWSMSKLCVTEPMRISAIFWMLAASGVLTVKFWPRLIVRRGAGDRRARRP